MLCYSSSAVTKANPRDVWAAWLDVARWSDGDVIEFARLKGDFQAGSTIVSKARGFPASTQTITRVDPPRIWINESRALGMQMTFQHLVEPGDAGTTITERVLISGPLGAIVGRVLRRRLEGLFAKTTEQIARRAEEASRPFPQGTAPE